MSDFTTIDSAELAELRRRVALLEFIGLTAVELKLQYDDGSNSKLYFDHHRSPEKFEDRVLAEIDLALEEDDEDEA